ncbi:hypothetical protein [Allorhodopirellula solitaria]|uniref:Uncharacterized protein n=1 Tax=Allorhodopirellula solitaria TaxID=2527987 RepID=A0A5C5XTU7_9BACT|nr:hypothetical protein [Allorhodopirellula solitaria]TWT66360.1 hypothetical protein CA85_24540 [Allorhodopirellula solitaria]
MADAPISPSRRSETSYLALALLPLLIVGGLLLYGFSQQWFARHTVEAELANLHADGKPMNVATQLAERVHDSSLNKDTQWKDLDAAVSFMQYKYDEAFRLLEETDGLVPASEPWPAAQLAKDYHEEAVPLIDRMRELLAETHAEQGSSPTWLTVPVYGNGNWSGDNLLEQEFRYAYHEGDSAYAAELLELSVAAGKAAMGIENVAPPYELIHRSLEHDFWQADDLRRLRRLLSGHVDREVLWRQYLDNKLALFLDKIETLNESDHYDRRNSPNILPFGIASTEIARNLRMYSAYDRLQGAGTRQHVMAARAVSDRQEKDLARAAVAGLSSIPLATSSAITDFYFMDNRAEHLARDEMEQRRTVTAVAIKQFQLQEGRWPRSLAELTQVGLASSDWKMVDGFDFGYQVDPGGQIARVWRFETRYDYDEPDMFSENFHFPAHPPSELHLSDQDIAAAETAIR